MLKIPSPAGWTPSQRTISLEGGERFLIASTISKGGFRSYEPEVFAAMAAFLELNPASHLLDVGANVGVFSLTMAALFGDLTRITAFEPAPDLFKYLESAVERNGLRVDTRCVALGVEDGEASFYLSAKSDASNSLNRKFRAHRDVIPVTVRRLDSIASSFVEANETVIMKIDTESTEPDVLDGARRFVSEHRPTIICEVLAGRTENRLAEWLSEAGYEGVHITRSPDWRGTTSLLGDPSYQHRDWLFLPVGASTTALQAGFQKWLDVFERA